VIAIGTPGATPTQVGPHIVDLEIAGTAAATNGHAILLNRTLDGVFERLRITGFLTNGTNAIYVAAQSFFNTFRDIRIDFVNQGIHIVGGPSGPGTDPANRNLISNCIIAQVGPGVGLRIGPNAGVNQVRDSNFESNTGSTDVLIEGEAEGTRISDSHFEGGAASRLYAIVIAASPAGTPRDTVLSGLHVTGFSSYGVLLDHAENVKITTTHFAGKPGNAGAIQAFNSNGVGVALSKDVVTPVMTTLSSSTFTLVP
jgi:hypothetical protein